MKTAATLRAAHPRHRSRSVFAAAVLLAVVVMSGCGKSPFELADVAGTVTIDGRPFTQGKVMFAPVAEGASSNVGKPAFGKLQPDGSFVLATGDDAGAVVGPHWATVIAVEDPNAATPVAIVPKFGRVTVPQRFTVAAGKQNKFDIKLSKQDVAKYGQK